MYNYLTIYEDKPVLIVNNSVKVIGEEKDFLTHSCKIVFIKNNYIVDSEKKLFRIEKKPKINLKHICKLTKGITSIFIPQKEDDKKEADYITDRFGNVLEIKEESTTKVMSNICYTTDIIIYESKIWTCDKYGRLRISSKDGKIFKYLFLAHSPITTMIELNNIVIVGGLFNKLYLVNTKTYEMTEFETDFDCIKMKVISKNDFVCVSNDSIIKFNSDKEGLKKSGKISCPQVIDLEFLNGNIYVLKKDGQVVLNETFLTKYKSTYDSFISHLNHD